MTTTDEKNVLKIIDEEGGECSEVKVSKMMALRLDYIRTILHSMGRRDLIDVLRGGKVRIAEKGWRALGKTPKTPWDSFQPDPEEVQKTPEEKYKTWMSR